MFQKNCPKRLIPENDQKQLIIFIAKQRAYFEKVLCFCSVQGKRGIFLAYYLYILVKGRRVLKFALISKKDISLIIIMVIWIIVIAGVVSVTLYTSAYAENRKLPVYSVDNEHNEVALTFNCAWDDKGLDELLEILGEEEVQCTFFFVGTFAEKYPDAVRKIYNNGHEIANHSMNHTDPVTLQFDSIVSDINKCNELLYSLTGVMPSLYRAPSGSYDNKTVEAAESLGMSAIQWNVDSIDWKDPSAEKIISRVTDKVTSGSIVLFHLGKENTLEALPEIIDVLKKDGYTFRPVSSLLLTGNTYIDNSGRQFSK